MRQVVDLASTGCCNRNQNVMSCEGAQCLKLGLQVLRRPETDDLQERSAAIVVAEREIGHKCLLALVQDLALAPQSPAFALFTPLPGERLLDSRIELLGRRQMAVQAVFGTQVERRQPPGPPRLQDRMHSP